MRLILPLITLAAALACTTASASDATRVALRTTSGDIVIELADKEAPKTVANFLRYVDEGYYSDVLFHRVIPGFMIQAGGHNTDYSFKTTHADVENESNNGLRNVVGTIAMARKAGPHTGNAQFFINHGDNPSLDFKGTEEAPSWGYTVFGRVVEGMDVVDKIATTPTGPGGPFRSDVPQMPVIILKAERVNAQ